MPDDQLRDVIQGLRSRLQDELDAQLQTLSLSHEQAVEDARRAGELEAEQRWAARLETTTHEWTARLENEIANARADAEKRLAAEGMRVRLEATQAAADAATKARREFDEAIAEERQRAQQQMEAERERAQQQMEAARERAQRDLAEAQRALEAERRRAEQALEEARQAPPPVASADGARLLDAIRRLDEATSLSDVLTMVANAAAAEAPRVTLFLVNTDHLEPWTVEGAAAMSAGWVRVDGREAGLLADAIRHHQPVTTSPGGAVAPAFASLPPERLACAVPFVLGGQPVAVLYADEGPDGAAPPAWQDAIQILGRHAAACLAHVTAARTSQAMRLLGGSPGAPASPNANEDEQGARRYARLLVSELKLYNESAVRLGRQKRDILQRLRPEIDRARRLYDERVPASVQARDALFQQELVQTLADGDPALLG
jgi:hypothetical protein